MSALAGTSSVILSVSFASLFGAGKMRIPRGGPLTFGGYLYSVNFGVCGGAMPPSYKRERLNSTSSQHPLQLQTVSYINNASGESARP